ncbi:MULTISPECIES: SsgA family sporulation/cell division regulator [unclassified Streptomyces]|uniref:SsgA family sporulation/cell division regulator n=1 Tax=unclassified Streptomyces TaxID=2593676 RepID=UPI00224CE537|nr:MULTISPECIES: SsgA family sporulation/cell division regulator [unclassified Streptomyces]MCX5147308.1 SsgA family sporulation/cell division regulator [Streptomyces sp. NBC_00320]WSN50439.1 SsgA family sporulation/cell division regulator [Streptomyces sp. NBC_01296]WSW60124.1 SsgA family sporulation/cell division regulator [Streptomyces sp. NBC_00998]
MSATAENPPTASAATAVATAVVAAAVEERVTARVITDDPLYRKIPVALRFAPAEPLAVRIVFPAGLSPEGTDNEWVFPRALLEAGLQAPTGTGDVRVWPCGRVQAVVEFHSPEGVAVIQFDIAALRRFLRRTNAPVTQPA